jgi:hypothetical protein
MILTFTVPFTVPGFGFSVIRCQVSDLRIRPRRGSAALQPHFTVPGFGYSVTVPVSFGFVPGFGYSVFRFLAVPGWIDGFARAGVPLRFGLSAVGDLDPGRCMVARARPAAHPAVHVRIDEAWRELVAQ